MLIKTNKMHRWGKNITTPKGTIYFNEIGEALVSEEFGNELIADSSYHVVGILQEVKPEKIEEIPVDEEKPEEDKEKPEKDEKDSEKGKEKGLDKEEAIALLNKSTVVELQEMAKLAELPETDWKKLKKPELVLFLFDKIKF